MLGSTERGLKARDPIPDEPLLKASTPTDNTPENVTSRLNTRRYSKGGLT